MSKKYVEKYFVFDQLYSSLQLFNSYGVVIILAMSTKIDKGVKP